MLKKRSYTQATTEPPPLELPRALLELPRALLELPRALLELPRELGTHDPSKKQKSVHFGAIQIVGQTDKSALESRVAAFNLSVAQQKYREGCVEFNRMIVAAIAAPSAQSARPEQARISWEECRIRLEALRIGAEDAIRHKLQVDTKGLLREYTTIL